MQSVVVAPAVTQNLQCAVGDDLVDVHVRRGAHTALEHVDGDLVVQCAAADLHARRLDGLGTFAVEQSEFAVRRRGGLFDRGQRIDKIRVGRHSCSRDRKVLQRTRRVHAVVGLRGNIPAAERIMLTPRAIGHGDASRLYGRDTGVGHRDSTFGAVAARAGAPAIRTPRSATDTIGSAGFTAAQGSFTASS